ncbi:MAG TPA: sterol desaturase family protein [Mycobacteriales bacterium]|jgi:sterol desaturase/sphingolipid hydroxylase (fatty acid hydroxylase superfamily)|nr:sterol desaturase family protein [Mycobacteriales bacterium]
MSAGTTVLMAAIPVFVLLLVVERLSYRFAPDDDKRGYHLRDSATSLSMGLGFLVVEVPWKIVSLAAYIGVYELTPLRLSPHDWWTWVVLFFADDFFYYLYHRAHHEIRLLWASHVVHHSSQRYNLSTALRQTWTPFTVIPFYVPLAAIGIPPWMILLEQSVSLIYQFWIHTERIDKMPRWFEWVWNTPSHHRVHHGSNAQYLDRNYGGILIVWDRIFGSFEPEGERVSYGLTKNISTYNPLRVAVHEYAAIWADVAAATRLRDRLAHVTRGPGWTPA